MQHEGILSASQTQRTVTATRRAIETQTSTKQTATTCRAIETQTSILSSESAAAMFSSERLINEETRPYEKLHIVPKSSSDRADGTGALENEACTKEASPYEPLVFNSLNDGKTSAVYDDGRMLETEILPHYMQFSEHGRRKQLPLPRNERERHVSVANAAVSVNPIIADYSWISSSSVTTEYGLAGLYYSTGQRQLCPHEGLYNCLSEMQTIGLYEHAEIDPPDIYESLAIDSGSCTSSSDGGDGYSKRKRQSCGLWHAIITIVAFLAVLISALVISVIVYKYGGSENVGVQNSVDEGNDSLHTAIWLDNNGINPQINSALILKSDNDADFTRTTRERMDYEITNDTIDFSSLTGEIKLEPFNAMMLLSEPRMHRVISASKFVRGITALSDHLIIVHGMSPTAISVYDSTSFNLIRNLTIPGSIDLFSIVSCSLNNCLYLCDHAQQTLFRYNLSDNSISNWAVGGKCYGLSVTKDCTIVVTVFDTNQLKLYSPDGHLINVIAMKSDVVPFTKPCHSIQLTSADRFVVNYWEPKQGGLCIVNSTGQVIHNYSRPLSASDSFSSKPARLAVDRFDNILVAYKDSDRVEILSSNLSHLGYIKIPEWIIRDPRVLYLDEPNRRLYIGLYDGRVFVLTDNR